MKMIRMAVLVAAATVAAQKAKEFARDNPDQASRTLDQVESFVSAKAGPKYADKVGKGGAALRSSLGLPTAGSGGSTDASTPTPSAPGAPTGFDPSI
jgi:antitoxin protein of toxin-antitoxin system